MHAAAAARVPLVDLKEEGETAGALKAEVCRTGVGASIGVAASTKTAQLEVTGTSNLAAKLKKKGDELQYLLREQHLRRVSRRCATNVEPRRCRWTVRLPSLPSKLIALRPSQKL